MYKLQSELILSNIPIPKCWELVLSGYWTRPEDQLCFLCLLSLFSLQESYYQGNSLKSTITLRENLAFPSPGQIQ